MRVHDLKIWRRWFMDAVTGAKSFEVRRNDRDFHVGDILRLWEYDEVEWRMTGRTTTVEVVYMTNLTDIGMTGYVAMGTKRVNDIWGGRP